MADKEIDFEELDRAIGALMEKQAAEEEVIDELARDAEVDNLDEMAADLVAKLEEDENIVNLAKTGAITDVEVDEIDQENKDKFVPETDGATVKVEQRVPVGFETSEKPQPEVVTTRPVKVPIPDDLLGKTVAVESDKPKSSETKTDLLTKSSKVIIPPSSDLLQPDKESVSIKKSPQSTSVETKAEPKVVASPIAPPKKTHIPHRRGKYIDFIAPGVVQNEALKPLSSEERRARAAKINRRQRLTANQISDVAPKPTTTTKSIGFEVNLPAKDGQPAATVKGNVHTGKTTVSQPSGEVVTIKEQTVELVSRPELKPEPKLEPKPEPKLDLEEKLAMTRRALKNAPIQPKETPETSKEDVRVDVQEPKEPKPSPFIPEAKVKKRPLGQPEPLIQSPSVTMHVPDRISTYDAGEQAALYRAELHPDAIEDKKSSVGWTVMLILIILIVAGLVYFFWGDVEALLR